MLLYSALISHTHARRRRLSLPPGPGFDPGNVLQTHPHPGRQTPFKPQQVTDPPTPPTYLAGMVPRPWFDQVAGLINKLPAPSTQHAPPDCAEWSTACLF